MKILVCSRISIPAKDRTLPAWEHLRAQGHTVWVEHPSSPVVTERPDAIISMGVTIMEETFAAMQRFPGTPVFNFNWDCYLFIWEPGKEGKVQAKHPSRPQEYDYVKYGELLRRSKKVWVPSVCTGKRTKQWWGIDNWEIILSACPWWEHNNIRDDGYALCTLRHLPDPWDTKFEESCEQVGIPYRRTDHELTYEDYQDAVAGCRFLVSHYYEASTGGLTLMEGYYHGKPCLLSDSEWMGARDYMIDRGTYFKWGNEGDFKAKLRQMYDSPPKVDQAEAKAWITRSYSDTRMVNDMMRSISANT